MVNGTTGGGAPDIPAAGWAAVIGGIILLGMVGTLLPILNVLRTDPVEVIRLNE